MYESGSTHEFAMVLAVPGDRSHEWERILRRATPPVGIRMEYRTPSLVMVAVQEDIEFLAIDRAEKWLRYLAQNALPPIPLNVNPQPANEV